MAAANKNKGFTLVELLVVISIIGMLTALVLPAVQAARERARVTQCQSNLTTIGTAMAIYENTKTGFPPGLENKVFAAKTEKWSWAIWMLPFIEQTNLYDGLLRTGWGPPAPPENRPYISTYQCTSNELNESVPRLSYAANMGRQDTATGDPRENGVFHDWTRRKYQWKLDTIKDGTSATLLVTERIGDFLWTDDTEQNVGVLWVDPAPATYFSGSVSTEPSSNHSGIFVGLFADGHVDLIDKSIGYDVYARMLTPDGKATGLPYQTSP